MTRLAVYTDMLKPNPYPADQPDCPMLPRIQTI